MLIEHTFDHNPLVRGSDVCIHSHHLLICLSTAEGAPGRTRPGGTVERVTELERRRDAVEEAKPAALGAAPSVAGFLRFESGLPLQTELTTETEKRL